MLKSIYVIEKWDMVFSFFLIIRSRYTVDQINFFNIKKCLGIANVFSSRFFLNLMRIDPMWLGQLGGFKGNPDDR